MEILVCSDSHGNKANLLRLVKDHPAATHLLFCGDGVKDLSVVAECFPRLIILPVAGNCDGFFVTEDVPRERLFTLGGVRILMMHGHLYGVKSGVGAALSYAKAQGADVLLFGHTHLPYAESADLGERRLEVFNPGSIGSYNGGAYSFGLLTIKENGFLLSHGSYK